MSPREIKSDLWTTLDQDQTKTLILGGTLNGIHNLALCQTITANPRRDLKVNPSGNL